MGRTNLIILFFGIFGCVALSLMMSHVVGIKDKKDVHPAVFELEGLFGDDLARRSQLVIEKQANRGEVAVLTVYPKKMETSASLSRMIGRHLVRFRGGELKFDELEVVARDSSKDSPLPDKTFPIKVPRGYGSLRGLMLPMSGASKGGPPPRRAPNRRRSTVGQRKAGATGAKAPTNTPPIPKKSQAPKKPAEPPKRP